MNVLLLILYIFVLLGGIHLLVMGLKDMDFSLLQAIFKPPYVKYIYMIIGLSIITLVLIQ